MFARRPGVIGTDQVGLTTGAGAASLGHRIACADLDPAKVERRPRGEVDLLEPRLAELVAEGLAACRLSFGLGASAALAGPAGPCEIVILCEQGSGSA